MEREKYYQNQMVWSNSFTHAWLKEMQYRASFKGDAKAKAILKFIDKYGLNAYNQMVHRRTTH